MSFRRANSLCRNCRSTSRSPSICSRACIGGPTGSLPLRNLLARMETFKPTVFENTSKTRLSPTSALDTWFRVLAKAVSRDTPGYMWHGMTFCSRWDPQRCVILCIGVDLTFQHLLQRILSHMWSRLPPSEPYSLHVPLIEAIIELHDSSVWSIRDIVRSIEKVSVTKTPQVPVMLMLGA